MPSIPLGAIPSHSDALDTSWSLAGTLPSHSLPRDVSSFCFLDPALHTLPLPTVPYSLSPGILGTKMLGTNQDPIWCWPVHNWELYEKGNECSVVYLICFLLKEVWGMMRDSRRISTLPHPVCTHLSQVTGQNWHLKNKIRNCALFFSFFSLKCFI